jgi:hypothetical protein
MIVLTINVAKEVIAFWVRKRSPAPCFSVRINIDAELALARISSDGGMTREANPRLMARDLIGDSACGQSLGCSGRAGCQYIDDSLIDAIPRLYAARPTMLFDLLPIALGRHDHAASALDWLGDQRRKRAG